MIADQLAVYVVTADDGLFMRIQQSTEHLISRSSARLVHLTSVSALARTQTGNQPLFAVVDMEEEGPQACERLGGALREQHRPQIITLNATLGMDSLTAAMRVGLRRCILKSDLNTELVPALTLLLNEADSPSRSQGSLVTVIGTTGGCGATTVATNVAKELGLRDGASSLLVDLDFSYGASATHLGVRPQFGLYELLTHGSEVDDELVSSTATAATSGIDLLTSSTSQDPFEIPEFAHERLGDVFSIAKGLYPFTIVDAPRTSPELLPLLIESSDLLLVVLELSVADLHNAKTLVNAVASRGFNSDNIVLVANRHPSRSSEISITSAREALNGAAFEFVPNDYRVVSMATNLGETLAEHAPRKKVRRKLTALAELVAARVKRLAPR